MPKRLLLLSVVVFALVSCGVGARCFASTIGKADGLRAEKEYVQAEAIYKQIISESNDIKQVLQAQKRLTIMYIESNNEPRAKQAFQELVAKFAGHEGVEEVVFELGEEYSEEKKYDRAREVYQYVVDHWPQTGEAIEAQEAVVRSSILLEDDAGAQQGYDDLITKFAGNEDLPQAVDHVADEYRKADKYEKARQLYRYIVQSWPEAERAIESQRAVVLSSIRMGDDANAASELEKLISDFAENEKIGWAVCEVADVYRELGRNDEALANYDYVVQTWPETEHAMEAQTYVAKLYISASDDANAQAAVDKLVTGFANEEEVVEAVEELAEEYGKASKHDKAGELYRRIAETWPDRDKAIWAQMAAVTSRIRAWDLDGAEGELGTLLVEFADNDRLGEAVHEIVEEYRNTGAHEESRELFNYLLAEWSAGGETMLELQVGVALQSIKLDELEKADAAVDKLINDYNDSPKIGKALFQIAEEHLLAKNYQKALTLWEVIGSNYPDREFETKIEIPFMLARCHYHLKDYPTAIEYFKRTVEELPGTKYAGWSSFYLAAGYRREGNYEKALEYYQKVADGWPELAREWKAHHMIGVCYEHLTAQGVIGKEEGHALIKAAYEQVIAEDPNSEAAKGARGWLRFNVKPEEELEGRENE